ncbi:transposase, partial [Streptococcus oralis]|uniref:transposase n=1 Tax=Streptococcus oralis TaxID=1303 RepID=UPI000A41B707
LVPTNKLIKDIKRQAFGFRNFKNFKTKILVTLNIIKERTNLVLSRCYHKSPATVDKEPL